MYIYYLWERKIIIAIHLEVGIGFANLQLLHSALWWPDSEPTGLAKIVKRVSFQLENEK